MNKSSIPAIVPEQSKSASFVMLVEIHNDGVPSTSNRDATVLSPTAATLQCPSAIDFDFEIESDSGSNSHAQSAYRPYYQQQFRGLTRLPSQTTSSRCQVDKEAIGLSRVQQFSHLCVARLYQISVNSIFKHIHTTSINTIIWQFVPFIYHPL